MARRLPESDTALELSRTINPVSGQLWRPAEIARELSLRVGTVNNLLRRNGVAQRPKPILPPVDSVPTNVRSFMNGLVAGGINAERRRWYSSPEFHVVMDERRSRYRQTGDEQLRKAVDIRRRNALLQSMTPYAEVRDDPLKTQAYFDQEMFGFMSDQSDLQSPEFYETETDLSPFVYALLAVRASEAWYLTLENSGVASQLKDGLSKHYEVATEFRLTKGRSGREGASLYVPPHYRQRLLEGVVGSSSVRTLDFYGAISRLSPDQKVDHPKSSSGQTAVENTVQTGGEFCVDPSRYYVDYAMLNADAKEMAARLFNDKFWAA